MYDAVMDFLTSDLTLRECQNFIKALGWHWEKTLLDGCNGIRAIHVFSKEDHLFSAHETQLTKAANCVFSAEVDGFCVFLIDLISSEESYYYLSAAIVKIFNVAFPGENLFFFRCSESIAVGCARSQSKQGHSGFCVSQLFSWDDGEEMDEFFYELAMTETPDFRSVIIQYSPQEYSSSKDYDSLAFDISYVDSMTQIGKVYDVNVSGAIDIYTASYSTTEKGKAPEVRLDVEMELQDVGNEDDNKSSYDDLSAAIEAEEAAQRRRDIFGSADEQVFVTNREFSDEAYENAELMLSEMMEKDKTS